MCAVLDVCAILNLAAEGCPELVVILRLILLHLEQLALDLLFQTLRDSLEVAVVLEHFAGDVERQVCGVYHAADKAEVVRQQIGTLVHDEHAVGVELKTLFIILGIIVHRSVRRDKQHRGVGHCTLNARMDVTKRRLIVKKLLRIEIVVVLVLQLLLGFLPDRDHGVQGCVFGILFPLGLVVIPCIRRLLLHARTGHVHLDRIADVVGVFFDQTLYAVRFKKFVVVFGFGVVLDGEDDLRAVLCLFTGRHGVAVRAVRLPAVCAVAADRTGNDLNVLCDHEGGVETDTELANDVNVVLLFVLSLEGKRAGARDGAEIALELLSGHAAAVVLDDEAAVRLVESQLDGERIARDARFAFLHRVIVEFIGGIRCIRDQLAQENLLVRINRVDHQVKQTLGLCLELFLCHSYIHLCVLIF